MRQLHRTHIFSQLGMTSFLLVWKISHAVWLLCAWVRFIFSTEHCMIHRKAIPDSEKHWFWDTFWVSLGAILSEFGSLGPSCDHLGISKVNMCIPSFHCREFLAQNFNWPNHIKIEMQTFDTCTCVTEHSCYMHETFFRLRTQPHSNMWTFAHSICSPDHCHSVLLVVWFVWHRMYCTNIGRAWYYHFENLWFSTICWSLNPLVCLSPSVEYLAIVSRCCWQLAVIAMLQCCSCEIDFTLLAGRESWYKLAALILEKLSELVLQKQYHPMCA